MKLTRAQCLTVSVISVIVFAILSGISFDAQFPGVAFAFGVSSGVLMFVGMLRYLGSD